MLRAANIPSNYYLAASVITNQTSITHQDLKEASKEGGILKRHKSKKTGRVYYKSKNMRLF